MDGLLRSLAKELRAGATANGILLADGAGTTSPSTLGALRFFLSGRSAFVDGQFLTVSSAEGQLPADAEKPLAGKVAVVTGAARGIGAAIARTLYRDGATLIVVDIPAAGDHLAAVANEVHGTALQLDISREDAGQRIIDHAVERHGRLDIVIHNAGITRDKLLANMDQGRWNSVIAVNIAAQLRINEALLASEHFRNSPRIVSVASTSGIAGNRGQTNYAASKGGVMGMVRATAPLIGDARRLHQRRRPGLHRNRDDREDPVRHPREWPAGSTRCSRAASRATSPRPSPSWPATPPAESPARCCASAGRTWWGHDPFAARHPGRDAVAVQALRQRGSHGRPAPGPRHPCGHRAPGVHATRSAA